MAGKVVVSTLNNDTGVLATQNGMTGIAKAWVNFNGGNGNTAGVINGSFNVSSITVGGTGDYTVNYTTAMPNTSYSIVCTAKEDSSSGTTNRVVAPIRSATALQTTSTRLGCSSFSNVQINVELVLISVFSS
jgi:hypothetical protein